MEGTPVSAQYRAMLASEKPYVRPGDQLEFICAQSGLTTGMIEQHPEGDLSLWLP